MNCKLTSNLIIDFFTTGHMDVVFAEHLKSCPDCRRELALMQRVHKAVSRTAPFDSPVPDDLIMARLSSHAGKEKEPASYAWFMSILVALIGIALVSPFAAIMTDAGIYPKFFLPALYLIFGMLLSAFILVYGYTHRVRARRITVGMSSFIIRHLRP
jgi:predicted anti-sigma-YlaC factor YlaD